MKQRQTLKDVSLPVPLEDCVELRSGKTPARNRADFWGGEVPWFSAKDLKSFRLGDSEEHITAAAVADGAPIAKAGELLVLVRGMTLMKDVPIGVLERDASFNQDLKALTPKEDIAGRYLGYMLAASKPRLMAMVDQAGHGTGRLAVERLTTLPIWVPDASTQEYIASRLQALDQLLDKLQELINAKRAFKRGLMQQLLTGQKRFPEFKDRPWVKHRIGEIFEEVERPVQWNDADEYQLVSIRRRSGGMFLREVKKGAEIKTKQMYVVRAGDIVISRMQVVHGAVAMVPPEFDGCNVSGTYLVLVPRSGAPIDPGFFDYLTQIARMYYAAYTSSYGVHIEKMTFNPEWYLETPVLLPPTMNEQRRIAQVLDLCGSDIDLLAAQREQVEDFRRALLSRLLSGSLSVPV